MKTVVSSSQVEHLFASNSQDSARNAKSSESFETTTCGRKRVRLFKSYSTGIAFYFLNKPETVFYGDRSYSITTSGHQGGVRSACSHLKRVTVPGANQGYTQGWLEHLLDAKTFKKNAIEMFSREQLRISTNKRPMPRQSAKLASDLAMYSEAFQILHHKSLGIELGDKLAGVAKREEARQAREQKKREAYYQQCAEIKAKQTAEEMAERLPRWRAGEDVYLPYHRECFLRIKSDGETVETSKGAEVPLSLAMEFFKRLQRKEVLQGQHVGAFAFTGEDNANVTIGCHVILKAEMQSLWESLQTATA